MKLELNPRRGERPQTHYGIPHHQRSEIPSSELFERTRERFLNALEVEHGPSLISVPGAVALFVSSDCGCEPSRFMRGREFAHIHPATDGSFHMVLSESDCEHVIAQGWGEYHPYSASGRLRQKIVMVYAPRDDEEIEEVLKVARAAHDFVTERT